MTEETEWQIIANQEVEDPTYTIKNGTKS